MGKSTINGPFSIAMLVYQRVLGTLSWFFFSFKRIFFHQGFEYKVEFWARIFSRIGPQNLKFGPALKSLVQFQVVNLSNMGSQGSHRTSGSIWTGELGTACYNWDRSSIHQDWRVEKQETSCFNMIWYPIGSMYAIYGNMDPINIPPLC